MPRRFACTLGVLGAILVVGCATRPAMREPEAAAARRDQDFATLSLGPGYRLSNNTWNRGAAHGSHEQAIFRGAQGEEVFGWQWRWPSSDGVVAYPEVIYGDTPWEGKPLGQVPELPLRVGSRSITVDYEISFEASGICNLAFEFWTVSGLPAVPQRITNEVMIWIDNRDMIPAGTWAGVFTQGGVTYDMFQAASHGDASGRNRVKWTYIAFLARSPVLQGPLDISAFAAFLQSKNLLTSNLYLTSLELGNEVITGRGRTEVRGYKVTIR